MFMDAKLDRQIAITTPPTAAEKFSFADIKVILTNRPFLYIVLLCVTFYSAVFPFVAYAPDFFADKFGYSAIQSGRITSLLPIGTAFFTPFFGFVIDKYGRSATAMILGSLIVLGVHLTFAFTTITPYVPVVFLGIAFSLVPAAMWPSMVRLVKESRIGAAYGIMYSVQNLGLWGIPLLA
jgi:MFS family permease